MDRILTGASVAQDPSNGTSEFLEWARTQKRWGELEIRRIERSEVEERGLKEFLGYEPEQLLSVSRSMCTQDLVMAQRAVRALLEGWLLVSEGNSSFGRSRIEDREAVEVKPQQYEFILTSGHEFWEGPSGKKMGLGYGANRQSYMTTYEMSFVVHHSDKDWLQDFIKRMDAWMDQHHFLRGQYITAKGEFLKIEIETRWDDVILPDRVRRTLERNCLELLRYRDLFQANKLPLKRGILLYGKPGTGKTMIGRALAQMCGVTFILATPGMMPSGEHVRQVFSWGRRLAPTILFFEDLDLVAGSRHSIHCDSEVLGEMLSGLDGLDSSEGVITIATTNDLEAIEPALKDRPNRFDVVLEIPPMGETERKVFLERWIAEQSQNGFDIKSVIEQSEDFTGAQMQELCRLAVMEAIEEHLRTGRNGAQRLPLRTEHFDWALARCHGSPRKTIGFVEDKSRKGRGKK